jgi:glycosyltransferase involved in cell wall biosynthesis
LDTNSILMTDPLITTIIPVYNCERYLGAAIESVLRQTWPSTEILVIDDGSTDRSVAVASRFAPRVKYEFISHQGAGAARNRRVALAKGDYLAFLDADDLWAETKLECQMAQFKSHPPADYVLGYVEQFVSPDIPALLAARIHCPAQLMAGIVPGTLLIPTATFRRVGEFSETLRVGEFIEWHSRAVELGLKSAFGPEVVLRRRLHATNSGVTRRDARSDYVRVVKAAIDRRRRNAKGSAS